MKYLTIIFYFGFISLGFTQTAIVNCDTFPTSIWIEDTLGEKGFRREILQECINWNRESNNYLPDIFLGLDTSALKTLLGRPDLFIFDDLGSLQFIYFFEFNKFDGSNVIYDKDVYSSGLNVYFSGSYLTITFDKKNIVLKSQVIWSN